MNVLNWWINYQIIRFYQKISGLQLTKKKLEIQNCDKLIVVVFSLSLSFLFLLTSRYEIFIAFRLLMISSPKKQRR